MELHINLHDFGHSGSLAKDKKRRLKYTIVITYRPSSIAHPSLIVHISDFSETIEWNLTISKISTFSIKLFYGQSENKDDRAASNWLRHFRLSLKIFNGIWQEARAQRPLPSLCFPDTSENKDVHVGVVYTCRLTQGYFRLLCIR